MKNLLNILSGVCSIFIETLFVFVSWNLGNLSELFLLSDMTFLNAGCIVIIIEVLRYRFFSIIFKE